MNYLLTQIELCWPKLSIHQKELAIDYLLSIQLMKELNPPNIERTN